ncbi:ethanolamine ammonia-lyase subunit EutC [Segnochrobactraceae bacterium EtOH-i3]
MSAPVTDPFARLRRLTQARIGLERAGDGLALKPMLEFQLAHARARDAVHRPLDVAAVSAALSAPPIVVASAAPSRADYLQRPDLGRRLRDADRDRLPEGTADVALVLADGLSSKAVETHGAAMIAALVPRLAGLGLAPVVIATQARVAIGDDIGAALGARLVAVLIGERPGLSSADSLGLYLTFAPKPGRRDSERNCISNIRPPEGLGYDAAADLAAFLIREALRRRLSGIELKDTRADVLPGQAAAPAIEG